MHLFAEHPQSMQKYVSYFIALIEAYVLSFLFTHLFFMPVYVQGESMEPFIKEGTIGFSNIAGRYVFGISRFDIVLIQRANGEIWIKRVIALPEETVEVKNHILYINGEAQTENYLPNDTLMEDFPLTKVEQNHVFVMGDNRANSYDSRFVGSISYDAIVSKDLYPIYAVE